MEQECSETVVEREDRVFKGNTTILIERLMRTSSDAIQVLDLDGTVLAWNGASADLYGIEGDAAVGARLPHVPEDMRLGTVRFLRDVAGQGIPREREAVGVRSDGSVVGVSETVIPFDDADGDACGVFVVAHGIHRDERFEEERMRFVAGFSRAVRGPASSVVSAGQLLARPEILDDPPRRRRTLARLLENAEAISGLVEDLFVAGGLVPGEMRLDLERVNLAHLVTDGISRWESVTGRVMLDLDTRMPFCVADRRRMARLIDALLANAVRHCTDAPGVRLSVYRSAEAAVIEMVDAGCMPEVGMGGEDVGLFGPDRGVHDRIEIGTAVASAIAKAHGGYLVVKVGETETVFTVRLPLAGPAKLLAEE